MLEEFSAMQSLVVVTSVLDPLGIWTLGFHGKQWTVPFKSHLAQELQHHI